MQPADLRIGIGHDTHRLGEGGPLLIGGVTIDFDRHLIGHSDADVLMHAVTDALLGAAALGDIGELYPNTDAENAGRDSGEMLSGAMQRVVEAGFRLINLDCIVFAQEPKLGAFKRPIAEKLASLLKVQPNQIGVKAKTGERVGPVGRQEAIMAECVALLCRVAPDSGGSC